MQQPGFSSFIFRSVRKRFICTKHVARSAYGCCCCCYMCVCVCVRVCATTATISICTDSCAVRVQKCHVHLRCLATRRFPATRLYLARLLARDSHTQSNPSETCLSALKKWLRSHSMQPKRLSTLLRASRLAAELIDFEWLPTIVGTFA